MELRNATKTYCIYRSGLNTEPEATAHIKGNSLGIQASISEAGDAQ